jgi:hypothetical protein
MMMISVVAKHLVGNNLKSHALVLFCNYNTKVGRDKRCLIQLECAEAFAFDTLYAKYGSSLISDIETLMKNSRKDPGYDYFVVLSMITNVDTGAAGPLCKISYLGYPSNTAPSLSLDLAIAQINLGDYNF